MEYKSLLRYLTPPCTSLLVIMLLLLINSGFALLNPWIAGQFTSEIVAPDASVFSSVRVLILLWLGVFLLRAIIGFSSQFLIGKTATQMSSRLRTRLYTHLQALPIPFYRQRKAGETLTLLSNDAEEISSFVTDVLVQMLPVMLTFCGAVIFMFLIDTDIASIAVILLPAYYIALRFIGRNMRGITRQWIDSYSSLFTLIEENLRSLSAVKAFTRERIELQRFEERNSLLVTKSNQRLYLDSLLTHVMSFLAGIGFLILLWIAYGKVVTGQLTADQLVSLLLYALLMMQPLSTLASVYGRVQVVRGSAERILQVFAEIPESFDAGIVLTEPVQGAIEFNSVSFGYPGRMALFKNLDLQIRAGETIAITGENGVGKTTLVYLLLRILEPDAGRILIDGEDIKTIQLTSLREKVGLVDQHTLLLNASVEENIAYGKPEATRTEIEKAAILAHAHEFISGFPEGYDTLIGDQGLRLSGGQRQRISLARTLLRNPLILILDEATSMFDPKGEEGFIAQSVDFLAGRTVILITHRPSSLQLADVVYKMTALGLRPTK